MMLTSRAKTIASSASGNSSALLRRIAAALGSAAVGRRGRRPSPLSTCSTTHTCSGGSIRSQTQRPVLSCSSLVACSKLSKDKYAQTAVASPVYSISIGCQDSQIQQDVLASKRDLSRSISRSLARLVSRSSLSLMIRDSMSAVNSSMSREPFPSLSALATRATASPGEVSRPRSRIVAPSSEGSTVPEPSASTARKAAWMASRSSEETRKVRFCGVALTCPNNFAGLAGRLCW
mmetsp:Transcript_15189/g.38606  ORF Transcript_15189/g.38606 Transcript_15189/m.38606 type:complete len:234 (+) Transcript_15189:1216-1917(+)